MNKQCTAGLLKKLCFFAACFLAAMFAFTGLVRAADASSISIHFIIRNDAYKIFTALQPFYKPCTLIINGINTI